MPRTSATSPPQPALQVRLPYPGCDGYDQGAPRLHRRRQRAGHLLQDLRFDRQHDHVGLTCDGRIIVAGGYAVAGSKVFESARVGVAGRDVGRFVSVGDQSADKTAGHVAAPDKRNLLSSHITSIPESS